jgi:hypothetical protein
MDLQFDDYLNTLRSNEVNNIINKKKEPKTSSSNNNKTPYILKTYLHERKTHSDEFVKANKKWSVVDNPQEAYTSKDKFINIYQQQINNKGNHKKPWSKLNSSIKTNRIRKYCLDTFPSNISKYISTYIITKYFDKHIINKWITYNEETGLIENIENIQLFEIIDNKPVIDEQYVEYDDKIIHEFSKLENYKENQFPMIIEPIKKKKLKT